MKKREYGIEGEVKTQVGTSDFYLTVKSDKSIGLAAEQFEKENPDASIRRIFVRNRY